MRIRSIRLELHGCLEIINRALNIFAYQQRLSKFIVGLGIVRLAPNYFAEQIHSPISLLAGDEDKREVIFGFNVVWILRQLKFELLCRLIKPPRLEMNQANVVMSERLSRVQLQRHV